MECKIWTVEMYVEEEELDRNEESGQTMQDGTKEISIGRERQEEENDMGNPLEEKEEENMEVRKKEKMLMPERGITKQEPKEEIKEEKSRDSKDSAIPAEKRDIALGSVRRNDRKEERREEEKEKDSKEHVMCAESFDIAQTIAGKQEKEKEAKEEHMSWNGRKSQRRRKKKKKEHNAWRKNVHGEDRS